MPSKIKITIYWLALLLALTSCSGPAAPAQVTSIPNPNWTVAVAKFDLKNTLQASETVTEYNGVKTDVQHTQTPPNGDVFLILNLTISKVGSGTDAFDWTKLSVQDQNGAAYPRDNNDTFLTQYSYTPRMTGLEIRFGVNTGWVCYSIPVQASKEKLSLVYTADGSQQTIPLRH